MKNKHQNIIFGGSGRFGKKFVKQYPNYITPSHKEIDITDPRAYKYICEIKPSIVIHAASVVGKNETERDRECAYRVNVIGTENIVRACRDTQARLIFLSSVSVFDGKKGMYKEDDTPCPAYYYGWLKLLGEEAVKILKNYAIIRTDFFSPEEFKYKRAFSDHYCTKMPVDDLVSAVELVADSNYCGIVNVGGKRGSLLNILREYFPALEGIKIKESTMPDFPCDLSLDSTFFHSKLSARK